MATKRPPEFNELGCRPVPHGTAEIEVRSVVEEQDPDDKGYTTFRVDCRIEVRLADGRTIHATTDVVLFDD